MIIINIMHVTMIIISINIVHMEGGADVHFCTRSPQPVNKHWTALNSKHPYVTITSDGRLVNMLMRMIVVNMLMRMVANSIHDDDEEDDNFYLSPKGSREALPCFPHWTQKVLQGKLEILIIIGIRIMRTE